MGHWDRLLLGKGILVFAVTGKLIVFSGIDAAGKSTQIDLLVQRLRRNGLHPIVFWSRLGYTPGMTRLKWLLRKLAPSRIMPSAGESEQRDLAMARQSTRRWWLRLSILDLGWFYAVWLRAMRWLGYTVICDRYLVDSELDFKLNFPDQHMETWRSWKMLKWAAVRPSAAFMLLIPIEDSQQRSRQKEEPFPDSRQRLEQRLAGYRSCCATGDWCVLDGRGDIAELSDQIHQVAFQRQVAIREED